MRVVTLEAIPNCRGMNRTLQVSSVLISMARKAKGVRRSSDELYARDVFRYSDFMATCASGSNGRVHCLALGFVFVTLDALGGVRILIQWHRVGGCTARAGDQNQTHAQDQPSHSSHNSLHQATAVCALRLPLLSEPARWQGDLPKRLNVKQLMSCYRVPSLTTLNSYGGRPQWVFLRNQR